MSLLVRALVRPLVPKSDGRAADVIVVLGAPLSLDGRLQTAGRERVEAGVAAWRAGLAPRLLFTGGRTDPSVWADLRAGLFGPQARERGGLAEAEAMRDHAVALGVPREAILVEDRARSTEENAVHVAVLMREHDLRRALLVTQPYHLRRSLALFHRAGVAAATLHVEESRMYDGGWGSIRSLRWVSREYVILALARLRGWL